MLIRDISLNHWITSGLELLVNINQAEYLTDGNQGAGAVVAVHPATRMPFPEDEGLLARPNRLTTFELTQVRISFRL